MRDCFPLLWLQAPIRRRTRIFGLPLNRRRFVAIRSGTRLNELNAAGGIEPGHFAESSGDVGKRLNFGEQVLGIRSLIPIARVAKGIGIEVVKCVSLVKRGADLSCTMRGRCRKVFAD
jgi:hypothetical protein